MTNNLPEGSTNYIATTESDGELAPDGKPLPPESYSNRVGGAADIYSFGKSLKDDIVASLPRKFSFKGKRILDFGCGSGRILRHFYQDAEQSEFWGCDIHMPSITWLTEHFSPPFNFLHNSETPSLPFQSNYFDLVMVASVFTHLTDSWQQWMMELHRVLKVGGHACISFHEQLPYEKTFHRKWVESEVGMLVINPDNSWDDFGPAVFHSTWWIEENWGKIFEINYIKINALGQFQSIAFMTKPSNSNFFHTKRNRIPIHKARVKPVKQPIYMELFGARKFYHALVPLAWRLKLRDWRVKWIGF